MSNYQPKFLDNITFASSQLQTSARDACGSDRQCLFDIAATNDIAVGSQTKDIGQNFTREKDELGMLI